MPSSGTSPVDLANHDAWPIVKRRVAQCVKLNSDSLVLLHVVYAQGLLDGYEALERKTRLAMGNR